MEYCDVKRKSCIDHTPVCADCVYAAALRDKNYALCSKNGVVFADYRCGKYEYDPLKRIPKRAAKEKLEYISIDDDDNK